MSQPTLMQVENMARQLSAAERAELLIHLRSEAESPVPPARVGFVDLRDAYKGCVPDDFDVTAALREIRSEWLHEMDAILSVVNSSSVAAS